MSDLINIRVYEARGATETREHYVQVLLLYLCSQINGA